MTKLSVEIGIKSQTNKETNKQTNRETDKQTNSRDSYRTTEIFYNESCLDFFSFLILVHESHWLNLLQTAVGADHVIVVTTESQVFSWGEGSKGQLGHGDTVSVTKPKAVEALTGKLITRWANAHLDIILNIVRVRIYFYALSVRYKPNVDIDYRSVH